MFDSALVQAILGFLAIVCVGALLRAVGLVRREDARPLNTVIVYVGLPAFIFQAVHGAKLAPQVLSVVAVAWVVFVVLFVVAVVAARVLRLDPKRAGGFVLAASLGNTGYLGYPLTSAVLGVAAVPVAVLYDVFGTVLQLVLVGFPAAARYGEGRKLGIRHLVGELVTFPALVAAVVALLTTGIRVPVPVGNWLDLIASMVAPLIMLSVGISLRPAAIGRNALALLVLGGLRLALAPALAAVVGRALIAQPAVLSTAVLQAGMPSMMLTLAVGERFGLDDDFVAAAIFVTTAASVFTVPLAQALIR